MALPSIDLDSIHDLDIKQTYYLLFDQIKTDFVTKRDLEIMFAGATAPPPDFKVKYVPMYVIGDIMAVIYSLLSKGLETAREGLISALESAIG